MWAGVFKPSADVVATRKKQLEAARKALQAKRSGSSGPASSAQVGFQACACTQTACSVHAICRIALEPAWCVAWRLPQAQRKGLRRMRLPSSSGPATCNMQLPGMQAPPHVTLEAHIGALTAHSSACQRSLLPMLRN